MPTWTSRAIKVYLYFIAALFLMIGAMALIAPTGEIFLMKFLTAVVKMLLKHIVPLFLLLQDFFLKILERIFIIYMVL